MTKSYSWRAALSLGILMAALALPVWQVVASGQTAATGVAPAAAQNDTLRDNANTVKQELSKRIMLLEQQEAMGRRQAEKLTADLGNWVSEGNALSDKAKTVEADIKSKESIEKDAKAQREKLEAERQGIAQEIERKRNESITCYIPIVQIYCWAADLGGQLATLDSRLFDATRRWADVHREASIARAQLEQLQSEQRMISNGQDRSKRAIADLDGRLAALKESLAKYREISLAQTDVLSKFTSKVNDLAAGSSSSRPEVIEREVASLSQALASHMGKACNLLKSSGPAIPANVQQACVAQ
ncbi:hypothetical protein [Dyella acidisoli]|uniref:Uncharacterized protein n=1 Tax=Dyella acidisoli TaxID=1867834 RepID=A0ABQ5XJY3_9GAMM|nr:hypothetical protein [Dyella acidisoli]GLQ91677.1 hypothetical protein GCM10007901_06270 [Dyella acidisoli]